MTQPTPQDESPQYICGIPIYPHGVDSEVDPENVRLGEWVRANDSDWGDQ
jgi:hypothetical protein